jgi:MFS family permease
MSALSDAKSSPTGTRSLSDIRHLIVALILSALPAAAAMAFPPTVLEDKNQTFFALYVVTLPWSLALSAIVAGFAGGWFGPDERKQILAAVGILLVSAVIGAAIAPGSPSDEHFQGGEPWVVVAEAIVFVVIGYALMYGWPMWFASFLVAAFVGWWAHERRLRAEALDVPTQARLLPGFEAPSPSVSLAGVGTLETPTLAPPAQNEMSFEQELEQSSDRPRDDGFAELTKAELYRRARAADIKGRSTMSKDELAAALRAQIG